MRSSFARKRWANARVIWLACLAFCLCMLVAPNVAWAQGTSGAAAGQGAEAGVPLAIGNASFLSLETEPDPSPAEGTAADAQDNGIPVLQLSIDPDEYQSMIDSDDHSYRAQGAKITLDVPEGYTGEFSETVLSDLENLPLEYVRGRGNSTWLDPKKPFKFKLEDKKSLLGMGEGKHWVLLANSYDDSLLRNRITSYIGRQLGLEYTPKMAPVDFYVNGEYQGSYVLSTEARVSGNGVDIDELGATDLQEPAITGGYLVALHPYDYEADVNQFTTSRGVDFFLKEPDFSEVND